MMLVAENNIAAADRLYQGSRLGTVGLPALERSRTMTDAAREERVDLLVALLAAEQQLLYWWETEHRCPCGARAESPDTHHHMPGCPTERATRTKVTLRKVP